MQWPAGDYALPTAFDQQFGQELIIFVNSDNNVLSYIENPFVSSIRYSLLSQGVQPTTAVTEAQGYAFNWNASSLRGQTVARALYHVVYNTSSNWKARANVTEPVARYSPTDDGSTVLEAGCGIGAQTVIVAPKNPGARFVSIDISEHSLRRAEALARSRGIRNVEFQVGDILDLKFPDGNFDHIFVCFVLEHLPDPAAALRSLKRVLKRGGTITLIEGDHGSAYFYPESRHAQEAINALVELQSRGGGNALIGRQLYPLLVQSGFKNCSVSPRMVYVDSSKPDLVEGFIKNTFTAMIEGIREKAVNSLVAEEAAMEKGSKTCTGPVVPTASSATPSSRASATTSEHRAQGAVSWKNSFCPGRGSSPFGSHQSAWRAFSSFALFLLASTNILSSPPIDIMIPASPSLISFGKASESASKNLFSLAS